MYLESMTELLGSKKTLGREITTEFDLIELSRRGIPKQALTRLADYIGSPTSQMADLLHVTERTLHRYAPRDRFKPMVSEAIIRIAEVVARGVEVFEDKHKFLAWVNQPSTALGGRIPMRLLGSSFGIRMVLDELGRIEHGVIL
ncbi:MAG: DUF2384 domain-containing protein [Kiritimatiellae bacterium]|nr:DUF2384 domain-containing protein [Kiritimatiellia bacterium]